MISTGENGTDGTAENENRASAEGGPATVTPMPRLASPVTSILTYAPVPPATVPTTSVTCAVVSGRVSFIPPPASGGRLGDSRRRLVLP